MLMLTLRKDITFLVIIAAIFGGLLSPIFSFNLAFATSESEEGVEGDTGDGGSDNGGNEGNGGGGVGSQPELQPTPTPEAAPEEGHQLLQEIHLVATGLRTVNEVKIPILRLIDGMNIKFIQSITKQIRPDKNLVLFI